jgi:hypothetical protein
MLWLRLAPWCLASPYSYKTSRRFRLQVKLYLVRTLPPPVGPYARIKLRFKTFKIKYFGAFGLKILSKWRETWDESTGIGLKKRKPTIPKLSRIKPTAFFIISWINNLSDLSTIQFRLIFKGHKWLEYWCLLIHLTSVSIISYAESIGGIFILIAPLGITNTISYFTLQFLRFPATNY